MRRAIFIVVSVSALVILACSALAPKPEVQWDPTPDKAIITATYCCGLVPQMAAENYIPEAQVWGDGRVLWVEQSGNNERRVLEGKLTAAEMTALLQRAVDDGFFGWDENYADYSVADIPSQCLKIELASQSRQVCEYYQGAPQAFHDLYDHITGGLGLTGADYEPTTGYLTAYPITLPSGQTPTWRWPADSLGFSLSEAAGGAWVEGETLELAWRIVNENPWRGLIQDGDDDEYYQISLLIPDVTQIQPPNN